MVYFFSRLCKCKFEKPLLDRACLSPCIHSIILNHSLQNVFFKEIGYKVFYHEKIVFQLDKDLKSEFMFKSTQIFGLNLLISINKYIFNNSLIWKLIYVYRFDHIITCILNIELNLISFENRLNKLSNDWSFALNGSQMKKLWTFEFSLCF